MAGKDLHPSVARMARRFEIAGEMAIERYGDDDCEIFHEEIESVDGGYWVNARVWVDADPVEDRLNAENTTP